MIEKLVCEIYLSGADESSWGEEYQRGQESGEMGCKVCRDTTAEGVAD